MKYPMPPDAQVLPDSRPSEMYRTGTIRHRRHGNLERVYCANCGSDGGYARAMTSFIFYICQKCEKEGGRLPLPVVPDHIARGDP